MNAPAGNNSDTTHEDDCPSHLERCFHGTLWHFVRSYGIRAGLAAVVTSTLFAAMCVVIPYQREKAIATRVDAFDKGYVRFEYCGPTWLQKLLPDSTPLFDRIWEIHLANKDAPPELIRDLGWLKNLRLLELENSGLTDAGLESFKGLSRLEYLDLQQNQITDAGIRNLASLTMLQDLYLGKTAITDTGLEHLQKLQYLETLDLHDTQVTDAGLRCLAELTELDRLGLEQTGITDAGLQHLASLEKLRVLYLDKTAITNAGIEHLQRLNRLEWLHLKGTKVTDAGLEYLELMTSLRFIDMSDTETTASRRNLFRQQHPNCIVRSADDND